MIGSKFRTQVKLKHACAARQAPASIGFVA